MDQIDVAQEYDQMIREHALFTKMRMLKKKEYYMPLILEGVRCCIDCKDVIPEVRLSIKPGAVRCVSCQTRRERSRHEFNMTMTFLDNPSLVESHPWESSAAEY